MKSDLDMQDRKGAARARGGRPNLEHVFFAESTSFGPARCSARVERLYAAGPDHRRLARLAGRIALSFPAAFAFAPDEHCDYESDQSDPAVGGRTRAVPAANLHQ